jgi:hypothetical protein
MEERPSSDGFIFVNYGATTKGQGPEAPMRSFIRAHLARQFYRKVRRQAREEWSSSSGDSNNESSARRPAALIAAGKKSNAEQAAWSTRDFHQPQKVIYSTDEDFEYEEAASSPRSVLGQGRLDPFKLFPTENVPVLVQKLLDHGEWPGYYGAFQPRP